MIEQLTNLTFIKLTYRAHASHTLVLFQTLPGIYGYRSQFTDIDADPLNPQNMILLL